MRKVTIPLLLALLSVAVMASGCCGWGFVWQSAGRVTGSGRLETREMDASGFSKLDISSTFKVEVVRAKAYEVEITADDNLFDHIHVEKRGKSLRLYLDQGSYNRTTLEARVAMPNLEALELSGVSEADLKGTWTPDDFAVDLSGASRARGRVETGRADLELSGSSKLTLQGTARKLSVDASGSSELDLGELAVEDADVELSGASSVTVNVGGVLDADLSGASRLYYHGSPELGRIEQSGTSSIQRR